MIYKNKNLLFAVLQVVAPSLKGLNHGQKLLIVDLVAGLKGIIFWKKKAVRYY